MQKLSVGESIRFGWETFKKRPLLIIGAFVIAMLVSGITSSLLDPAEGAPVTVSVIVMSLISAVIGLLVEIGLVTFSLRAHDNVAAAKIMDLWNPKPFVWYLVGQIAVGLGVLIGFVLLIVPGVMLALGWMFSSYLIIDKGRGPLEAMKESWAMTKGHKWQLLLLVLALIGINILGLLALVVGLLVTVPVSMLAVVHVYRKLSATA
jgi:uncharacterized membrane protein